MVTLHENLQSHNGSPDGFDGLYLLQILKTYSLLENKIERRDSNVGVKFSYFLFCVLPHHNVNGRITLKRLPFLYYSLFYYTGQRYLYVLSRNSFISSESSEKKVRPQVVHRRTETSLLGHCFLYQFLVRRNKTQGLI